MKEVFYPIGEQNFEKIITGDWLYVDKTGFIRHFLRGGYYFLGRPRRFGKSLFLSTLRYFFEGRRELFKGLAAETFNWSWAPHPVLYLDLNAWGYQDPGDIDQALDAHMSDWESHYHISSSGVADHSTRLRNILRRAHEITGKRVVVLVDEYDKPLVNSLNDKERYEANRIKLSAFYSGFKSSAEHIHLLFLTGVSRFGKVSIFSGLNNIQDISVLKQYDTICGISESELDACFKYGVEKYAEISNSDIGEVRHELKKWYDGYHFSEYAEDVYNPFSLMLALDRCRIENFWMDSGGKPTLLIETLRRNNISLYDFMHVECNRDALIGIDIDSSQPIALFYQTGYLTIKEYDSESDIYTLGLPNGEVKKGFMESMLPYCVNIQNNDAPFVVSRFVKELRGGDVEGFMRRLQSLFASVPYDMHMNSENNVHNALYMLMLLLGLNVKTEYRTSSGRIDLFVATDRYYYIIELKFNGSSAEALEQINRKNYSLPFAVDDRRLFKIGVNFSSESRTITDWIVE